jgi:hypothetical protein
VPRIINHATAHEFHDITPPPPVAKPAPAPIAHRVHAAARAANVAYGSILAASLSGRFTRHRSWFSLISTLAVVGLLTAAGLALASHSLSHVWQVTRQAGWAVYGELVIVAGLYYLLRSLTQAAIVVGTGRLADHRPLPTHRWLSQAADSQGRRLELDVVALAATAAVAGLCAWLVVGGGHTWPTPLWVQVGALMIGFASLLYLLLALIMTISLAHVALSLTALSPASGLALGWRLFRHHFELAGARLVALLVEAVGLGLIVIGGGGWLLVSTPDFRPVVIVVIAGVATIAATLAGAGSAIWWTLSYRQLVQVDHPAGFHRLLATTAPKAARRAPVLATGTALVTLAALAAAWPWLVR